MDDTITIEMPETTAISTEVQGFNGCLAIPVIKNDSERMTISEKVGHCKRMIKQINDLFKDSKKAASSAHKAICNAEKKLTDPVLQWVQSANARLIEYDRKKEQERRAEEARLQAEAQAKADAEKRRLEAIAARCKNEEKKQAYEEAARSVNVYVPEVAKVDNKAEGEIQSISWVAKLQNFEELIKAAADGDVNAITCLSFDQSAANKLATAFKRENVIAGVAFEKNVRISHRG